MPTHVRSDETRHAISEYIAQIVAQAPKLTGEKRDAITRIFTGAVNND